MGARFGERNLTSSHASWRCIFVLTQLGQCCHRRLSWRKVSDAGTSGIPDLCDGAGTGECWACPVPWNLDSVTNKSLGPQEARPKLARSGKAASLALSGRI